MNLKLKVDAGNLRKVNCPVSCRVLKKDFCNTFKEAEGIMLKDNYNNLVPVQLSFEGDYVGISWILDVQNEKDIVYELIKETQEKTFSQVELNKLDQRIDVKIQSEYFTSYVYNFELAKPYLGPITQRGKSLTRLDFDTKEHPHQRSIWIAIGDVNGIDFWNEPKGIYGKQIQKSIRTQMGYVFSRISAENIWTSFNGEYILDELRNITIYNLPKEGRYIDFDICLKASYGKVQIGATKEAGPLGIRVSEDICGKNGGRIFNSLGAEREEECWGRKASWCDYYGNINGEYGGIGVFDHPQNVDYPTHWHVRSYGLLAPNNFFFTGPRTIEPNETLKFKYRLYFHEGDTKKAMVEQKFNDYINPPKIETFN